MGYEIFGEKIIFPSTPVPGINNDQSLKFNNFHKQQAVPFVIYADFEAITKNVQGYKPNNDKSYTEAYQTREDCGYGYKVVCCYKDKYSEPIQMYRGQNAVYKFMEKMLEEVEYCKGIVKKRFNKPLKMTENDELRFKQMDECHICGNRYTDKDVRETIVTLRENSGAQLIKNVT